VGLDTRIPLSRRPIAVEDDQTVDESSHSISPLVTPGELLSQTLRKPKHFHQYGGSVSAGVRSLGPGIY
jgi:hypothetical protein